MEVKQLPYVIFFLLMLRSRDARSEGINVSLCNGYQSHNVRALIFFYWLKEELSE